MGKFYEYSQNNNGGKFDVGEYVCARMLIEAESEDKANTTAEDLGCYWDGVRDGIDCPCCGDRWYNAWNQGISFPYKYSTINEKDKPDYEVHGCTFEVDDKPVHGRNVWVTFPTPESYMQYMADQWGWTKPDGRIFYLDGRVVDIYSKKIK